MTRQQPLLHARDRAAWRKWLARNHDQASEIWLVYFKGEGATASVPYDAAVEEAICFGWIDSLIRRLDDERYARKFTPRKPGSKWSPLNLARAKKLVEAKLMTAAGLVAARQILDGERAPQGKPSPPSKNGLTIVPGDLEAALKADAQAWANFAAFPPGARRNYVAWVQAAKRDETRQRRVREAVALARKNVKALLK